MSTPNEPTVVSSTNATTQERVNIENFPTRQSLPVVDLSVRCSNVQVPNVQNKEMERTRRNIQEQNASNAWKKYQGCIRFRVVKLRNGKFSVVQVRNGENMEREKVERAIPTQFDGTRNTRTQEPGTEEIENISAHNDFPELFAVNWPKRKD